MTVVVDAAALMALMLDEPGANVVAEVIRGSLMSAVNLSECCARGVERGASAEEVLAIVRDYEIQVVSFDVAQALEAARLREATRGAGAGAGIGDRPCLALARLRDASVYTADRRMAACRGIGVDVWMIR